MSKRRRRTNGGMDCATLLVAAACLAAAGCAGRYIRIEQKGLTCSEAHQIAITAVQRLGYTIQEVKKPVPGSPGIVSGMREEGANKQTVFVQVFCTSLGAELEAKAEGGGFTSLTFPSDFKRTFEAQAAARPPVRKAADSGVDVLLVQERTNSAELGTDLTNTGILPVSVRITNKTKRRYGFVASEVVLQTAEGEKFKPLTAKDIAAKATPGAAETLAQKTLGDRDIAPDQTLTGYLFFPFKAYSGARVTLTDRESDEPEGFSIEF